MGSFVLTGTQAQVAAQGSGPVRVVNTGSTSILLTGAVQATVEPGNTTGVIDTGRGALRAQALGSSGFIDVNDVRPEPAPSQPSGGSVLGSSGSALKTAAEVAADPALKNTFSPIGKGGLGNRTAVFGDSLANFGQGFIWYLAANSQQRFWVPNGSYVRSNPGFTSAQLAAIVTQVTTLNPVPDLCIVTAGSNDAAGSVPAATFAANMTTTYAALRAAGIVPVATTVPPRTGIGALQRQYNSWMRRYAVANRMPLLDWSAVLSDPASITGAYRAAYDSGDGIHPSTEACVVLADDAATRLSPLMLPAPSMVESSPGGLNLAPGSTFVVDSNTDGLAEYLTATPSTGFSQSRVLDSAGYYWQRITLSGAVGTKKILSPLISVPTGAITASTLAASAAPGASTLSVVDNISPGTYVLTNAAGDMDVVKIASVTGAGPYTATLAASWTANAVAHGTGATVTPAVAIGDTLSMSARLRNGQASANTLINLTCYTTGQGSVTGNQILGAPNSANGFTRQITSAVVSGELVIPANTALIQWDITVGATDGTYDVALPTIRNLSRPHSIAAV